MRQIAAKAGVCNSTVSLALRNSPLISEAVRKKIQKLALRLGYRPDPEIARLMQHLRQRVKPRFKSVIVGLTTVGVNEEQQYLQGQWEGVLRRAAELGYGAKLERLTVAALKSGSFLRTLRNRGVEGLVLLPQRQTLELQPLEAWNWFSVVVTTYSVLKPHFHRVVPDQFGNTLTICQQLEKRGCRRIGFLLLRGSDATVDHRISGAVAWQNLFGRTELVEPLVYDDDYAPQLAKWFRREAPDGIVVGVEVDARRVAGLLRLPIEGRVLFGIVDNRRPFALPGIDQLATEVGAAAVTVLNNQLQNGERGVPSTRQVTMVQGVWHAGTETASV